MKRSVATVLMAASALWALTLVNASQVSANDAVLIRAANVYTMSGPPIQNVEVLVRDGRIVGIGDKIVPLGEYKTIEVHTLIPGLVDAHGELGLRGGNAETTREVTPEFETSTTIDWRSRDFTEAAAEGTTSVNIMPGTDNVICGFSCLVKTAGGDLSFSADNSRIMNPRVGLAMAICSDPAGGNRSRTRPDSIYVRQPTNRMGVVWIVRSGLSTAQKFREAGEPGTAVSQRLTGVLSGETKVFGISRTSFDIETLVSLGDEFGFSPVLFGGHEAYKTIDLLSERGVPVVYTASPVGATRGEEQTNLFWNTPGKLDAAGINVCLAGGDLLNRARFAKRFGMDAEAALASITTRPADLLGAGNRIGRIAAEYDADLIALDGPPLEFTSNIQWVMANGQVLASDNGE